MLYHVVFKSPSFFKNYIFRYIYGLCIRKITPIDFQDVIWPKYKLEYYNSFPDCSLSGFRNRNIFIFCKINSCFAGTPIIRPDEFFRPIQWLNCLLNSIVSILITFPDFFPDHPVFIFSKAISVNKIDYRDM